MNKIATILFGCLFLTTGLLQAMPPREGVEVSPAVLEAWKRGVDSPKRGLLQKLISKGGEAKVSGSRSYPVVLGYFTDLAATNTQAQFQAMLFNTGSGVKSVNNYYRDMSYNAMSCSGKVDNWRTSNNTVAWYTNGTSYGLANGTTRNTYEFITKVLVHADSFTNFADPSFDQDHDGYVDVLWVTHAGKGAEEGASNIWSHSFYLSGFTGGTYYTTKDISPYTGTAVRINDYIINPERTNYADGNNSTTEMIGAGVYCHEFGHALGLPDLYDTGDSGPGIGNWSIMAGGSWGGNGNTGATPVQMDVWCKRFLGWIVPFHVTQNGKYSFSATLSDSHRTTARLSKLGLLTNTQFWLIEDRRSVATGPVSGVAWDQYIYNSGLAIYHIDSTYTTTTYINANTVNASNTRAYGVALEETDQTSASYTSELYNGTNQGDAADMWNSSTQANFDSTGTAYPITYLNNGTSRSGTAVRKIPAAGKGGDMAKAMLCTLYVIPAGPLGVNLSQFTAAAGQNCINLNWRTESEMESYAWEIERCSGASEEYKTITSLPAYGTTNFAHEYSYTDDSPELVSGVYYYRLVQTDATGEVNSFGPVEVNYVKPDPAMLEYALLPCYPNPSKGVVSFGYVLKQAGSTSIKVYNLLGMEVKTMNEGWKESGAHTATWDGRDLQGKNAANGIYFYKLVSGKFTATKKIAILR